MSGGSSSQIVTDTVEATYINELTVTGGQGGEYTCNVTTLWAHKNGTLLTVGTSADTVTVPGTYVITCADEIINQPCVKIELQCIKTEQVLL